MTTPLPLGERVIYDYIRPHVESFSNLDFTHNDHKYRVTHIPDNLVGRTMYAITDEHGEEVFRFTFCFEVSKLVSPHKPLAPLVPLLPIVAPEIYIEGQWGPSRTPQGLTYASTPVAGDTVWSPVDKTEWVVLKALGPTNHHEVTVVNDGGKKITFQVNWDSPVRFRRSNIFHATKIVKDMLNATEVDDSHLRQDGWILGGRK